MNRSQRRAAAKKASHGRVTPKKDKPGAFVTIRDENGRVIKTVPVEPEEVSEEEFMEVQRQQAAHKEAQMKARAHMVGLWIPGDAAPW